jgi:hypothetical protein
MSVSVQTAESATPTAVPPLPLAELVHPDVLAGVDRLAAEYRAARPYPHIAIDGFLRPEMARSLYDGFPRLEEMSKVFREPMSYKGQLSDIDGKWPAFSPVFATLQSAAFRGLVGRISGIDGLLPDAILAGGGLHQSPRSGFLDLHVDANMHPFDKTLHRRVNILIYVQPGWQESWGGQLELWSDRNHKPFEKIRAVVPAFNRAVIFSTTRTSWHGVAAVNCPDGSSRKSLALYYYTTDRPKEEIYQDSSVIWMNRSSPWKRALYPVMNFAIARLKPYARYLRRSDSFDAAKK